jgi:hypothetical protein
LDIINSLMVSDNRNNKTTVRATLAPMLLSLTVASLIAMSTPNYVSAQGLFEGLEREQSGQPEDVGAAPLNDTTTAQPGDVQGSDGASTTMTGNATNATTTGNATNATTTGAAAGETQSEVMLHLEEVRTALQNNDIQGAMMHLELAMNVLGGGTQGNMTSTTGSTNSTA